MINISNQSELSDFLGSSDTYSLIGNAISLVTPFMFTSSNGEKVLSSDGTFVVMQIIEVGEEVEKDMRYNMYDYEHDPQSHYPDYFPDMEPFTDENIVEGDKQSEDRLRASYWRDWGNDIFDNWGFFYLYDVELGKYYFPLFSPRNDVNGSLFTQTFNAFGRAFTITHGYPVQGIFKFDISVNDNKPFKFGGYGNMGSDGDEINTHLTHSYLSGSTNKTLYYVKQEESGDEEEIIYSYFIPKNLSENNMQTYNLYQTPGDDNNSLMSRTVTTGLIVYFSKTNDVKEWIVNNLTSI